ncbi:unnamed protein product [Leptosia nina]|uniref:Peptide-N(4)-(N-acetyl-beta-glucosaminyl)asparagine amidase n=1 Tax=Leptosia nina TaxID=320188 RepID=A0AAV1JQJ4_9NEOP
MEDMARLAVVEQEVRDIDKFGIILHEILYSINNILENPQNYDSRHIKSDIFENILVCPELKDYLTYIGFQWTKNKLVFPKEQPLNRLRMAKSAIERKIGLCYGTHRIKPQRTDRSKQNIKKYKLAPVNALTTTNNLLLKIQSLFNRVLDYEDEALQQIAKDQIPMITLELRALKRMRDRQKKIKKGETKESDLSYDIAFLMELIGWFKAKYFSWVNEPKCETCAGPTNFHYRTTLNTETETCNVEMYFCYQCQRQTIFPRYNDVRVLMRTRRGRCGEWAQCFAMFCRALGYETRYVDDFADHVWCEVYDYESNCWLHVDPCEGALDTPLMYCHGWGKKLSYVVAVSCDDVQDVTWRYTTNFREVMSRRKQCHELELISTLLTLRAQRQAQLSTARRKWLTTRTLRELVHLMVERKPSDFESRGRISGSKEWRTQRGEMGSEEFEHVFEFDQAGEIVLRYHCSSDKYIISRDGGEVTSISGWSSGVYKCEHVFRNVEEDWKQVYLAREEGEKTGEVSWKLRAKDDLLFTLLNIQVITAVFETGNVKWSIQYDDQLPMPVELTDKPTKYERKFKEVTILALLSGGEGDVAWQHAQLFRQQLDSKVNTLEIRASITSEKQ